MALTVVVAYDVSADGRRARLAGLLQRFGDRIQYSVFVCTMEEAALAELLDKARTLLDLRTDSLYILRQCAECWAGVKTIGQAHPPDPVLFWAVL